MINRNFRVSFLLAASLLLGIVPAAKAEDAAAGAGSTLPGGSSSLQETFGAWQVGCAMQGAVKHCAVTQQQINQQTGQRIFAVEISTSGDKLEGVLLMPFGLVLDRGVTLQLDDQPAQPSLKFRTCLPGGCVVPFSFDAKATAALRAATTLKIQAAADGGADQAYAIPLKGFAQAIDRVAVLSK